MRFSDLKKIKDSFPAPAAPPRPAAVTHAQELRQPPAPEQPAEELKPAAPPSAHQPRPAPAEPAPAPAAPTPAATPRSRREIRTLSHSRLPPFEEMDAGAREVYSRLMAQSDALLRGVQQTYTEKYEDVLLVCRLAAETLKTNPVLLNYTIFSTAEDYLVAHTANTAILALAMGLEAGLNEQELGLLGFCSMAHDIGMVEFSSFYNRSDRLDQNEIAEMSLHAEAGVVKLDRIVDLDYRIKERAKHIVLQTHERADGTGYPDRLSDEEIDPLAQFLSIADAYEAMTHPRAWRAAANPADAIKELVEKEGGGFNTRAVRALVSAVSIYPPGSLVALSSGDIARVVRVTRGFLTKPLVSVLLDQNFAEVAPVLLDLFEHPLVSIERPVGFKEVADGNPGFADRLQAADWWPQ